MNVVWDHFRAVSPRKECTVMSDNAGKLRQPLMTTNNEDDTEDEEMGGLLPREVIRTQFDEGVATRRKRRRRKEDEDLGEVAKVFLVNVKPLKVLQFIGRWVVSLSTVGNLLSSPKSSSPTSLSTQMVAHGHKVENMDDVSERALAVLAIITLGFCCLLLLVVYVQTV
ncbi:unnamed protein product [Peronospora farinosa]|uniref:Uncharacterized protein n=1 Tax=Peronospora farinosa TaxID=134698 RepID=A0AAV0T5W4_9STRA|nr:unnamed protein product [Peronospora farinosa]